ncbi:hypothetical protein [uncultured Flavobacterium sp.]|uniref:hypothetical protein n=1 Tax=uncultured Flavobacterium sp. TaxID=165435 RepID=UPI0025F4BEE5|nr:hypothetical protein [uncultured Flavobacterium sp.]
MASLDKIPNDELLIELNAGTTWLRFDKNMGIASLQIKYSAEKDYGSAAESNFLTRCPNCTHFYKILACHFPIP